MLYMNIKKEEEDLVVFSLFILLISRMIYNNKNMNFKVLINKGEYS